MIKDRPAPIDIEKCSSGLADWFAVRLVSLFDQIPHKFLYDLQDNFTKDINSKIIIGAIAKLPEALKKKLEKKG